MTGLALDRALLPGFIAATGVEADPTAGLTQVDRVRCGAVALTSWGLDAGTESEPTLLLSRVVRRTDGAIPLSEIDTAMRTDPATLTCLLPPFAVARGDSTGVSMVADSMGFRQLFHSAPSEPGPAVLSTSALLVGWTRSAALDDVAVAVQSRLGWQLGQRTLFRTVGKLEPGAMASLDADGVRTTVVPSGDDPELTLDEAVTRAAGLLRTSLNALLDDHPDAVLQLTGGLDSRLLLSAVPPERRRGLRAMTLGIPGNGDVAIASLLADRVGLRHEVRGLPDLSELEPAHAWELCRVAAIQLDAMSDPVALAALTLAERSFDQGVRISGLGGEIARGFYYIGRPRDRAFDRADADRLAAWRMFANESVEPGLLTDEFDAWGQEAAEQEVFAALAGGGSEWFRATDELYLRHRMQRWAGATDTAVGYQRIVVNPMLAHEFLGIAARLTPRDKAQARFLARLQLELDPDLGRIPLEGRPPPTAYANPSPLRTAAHAFSTGRRLARKVTQRVLGGNRPPAGGAVLAGRVVDHWRRHPEILASATSTGFIRQDFVAQILEGRIDPRPSSVALLTNLVVASSPGGHAP